MSLETNTLARDPVQIRRTHERWPAARKNRPELIKGYEEYVHADACSTRWCMCSARSSTISRVSVPTRQSQESVHHSLGFENLDLHAEVLEQTGVRETFVTQRVTLGDEQDRRWSTREIFRTSAGHPRIV